MLKKLGIWMMVLMMIFPLTAACADEPSVDEIRTQIGEHYVSYPQLKGLPDASVQQKINDDIVLSSGVANHLVTLATLGNSPWKLAVDFQVCMLSDQVFSVVISARGKLPGRRDGHSWTALSYDLATGDRLTLDQLLKEPDEAVARMEAIAEASLSQEWSGYMEYADILPLPVDAFTLDEKGITFWYPYEQFSLLSGTSGACQFWYEELDGLWIAEQETMTDEQIIAAIEQTVAEGKLPKVPAVMGQPMQEVTEQYRLLRTPDVFPGGRYYVMEDPAFREVLVISDALDEDGSSVVEGIQLKRGGLFNLLVGKTEQQRWRDLLGMPEENITVTAGMAYDYHLPEGQYDVYHFGENELRLYADLSGVLSAVQICR